MVRSAETHEHAWERIPRSWPPRFRCTARQCEAIGRIQRDREAIASTWKPPRIAGWGPDELRLGAYMQEVIDGS